ncbi:hypothetical protein F3Y22_tig00110346pilonHSYRG00106 [Hibiscus syriacus]|uniref:Uncharacterized protein n=1 Tax=Hibiscus syriacus TaxID=106335 RepID=A0A6A3AUE9_HIBSY|nr:hypothetical protein F3Y22_tig00110346pilonHSYRG00106 [Hibiscus syriacus]
MRGNPSNRVRVGRHALRATYPRSVALGFPRITRSVALGCPRIARSDGLGRMASDALGWPWMLSDGLGRMLSDGLGCFRMASVGWPRMPSVLGRAWRPGRSLGVHGDLPPGTWDCRDHPI